MQIIERKAIEALNKISEGAAELTDILLTAEARCIIAPHEGARIEIIDGVKSFIIQSKAWYSNIPGYGMKLFDQDWVDEISITFRDPETGGCFEGEVMLRWYKDGNVRLEVFDEAWNVIYQMPELLKMLASFSKSSPSVDDMVSGLISLGYTDITEYERK